jgi:hypothetical protein
LVKSIFLLFPPKLEEAMSDVKSLRMGRSTAKEAEKLPILSTD